MIVAMNPPQPLRKLVAPPREVVILVYPGVQSLDLTGPLEVFSSAQLLLDLGSRGEPGYRVSLLSRDGTSLVTSSG
jgi:transcriptional regulator GlxA family with amidase domain